MPRIALLTLSLLLGFPLAMPRAAAAQLNYALYVLGVPVADAVLTVDMVAADYRISLEYHHIGLVSVVARNRLEMQARGGFQNGQPAPVEFASKSRLRGEERSAALTWRAGTPVVTALVPSNEGEREEVTPAQNANAIDPMSTIVLLLRDVARTGRCEGRSRAYDGRRLRLLEARTTGEELIPASGRSSFSGRALRCDFTEQTLAGFRLGAGREADARTLAGTIWLASVLPGGAKLPVQVSVETRWLGPAVI